MSRKNKIRFNYTVIGTLLGFCFPILATIVELMELDLSFSWKNVADLHMNSSLIKIVDLAPFILGVTSYILGVQKSNLVVQRNLLKLKNEKQEIEIKSIHKTLSHKNKDLDDLTYATTHDLKSTLRGISSLISALEEESSLDERTEYQNLLKGRIKRMDNILDGFMKYVRISRKEVEKNKINLYSLFEKIKVYYNEENIHIQLKEDIPEILFDSDKFEIIMRELIDNSIKFSSNGQVNIIIDGVDYNEFISLMYSDNGPGIEYAYKDKVFNMFSTLENRDTMENVGMGLTIVKRALEQENGTIRIMDNERKGVCFELQIPN